MNSECCAVLYAYPGSVGYSERSRGSECQETAPSEAIDDADDAKSMWPCQRRDVDLKIAKPENLKRRQKEVCPLMTGTALEETMETWLDVIPLLEVGRALVSRRCTCLRALRSLYHLTAQNIRRSRWPCDRRPLYVLERRRTNPPSFKHRIWCANPDGSSFHVAWIAYGWQCSQKSAGAHKGIRKSPGYFWTLDFPR